MRSEDTIARLTAELREEMLREARIGETKSLPQAEADEVSLSMYCRLRLEWVNDPATTCLVSFTGEAILGRSEKDDQVSPIFLMLDTEQFGVSRQHAKLQYADGVLYLLDLGSTNGTRLNGRRLGAKAAYPVTDGDVVALGWLEFIVRMVHQPSVRGDSAPVFESQADLLSMILRAIGAQHQLPALIQKVIEIAQAHTAAQSIGIWCVDEASGELFLEAYSEPDASESELNSVDRMMAEQAIRQGKLLRDRRAPTGQDSSRPSRLPSDETLYLPLMVGTTPLGVVSAQHREIGKTFKANEVELLSFIADAAAVGFQNVRLYQSIRQDQVRLDKAMTAVQYVLGHDMRRLLNDIVGHAGLLHGGADFDQYTDGVLGRIVSAGTRLLDITDRLSSVARLSQYRFSMSDHCDLLEYIDQLIDPLSDSAGAKSVRIETQSFGERYLIHGDPEYLILSIHSLIDNAVKFSPPGGIVNVDLFFSPQNIVLRVGDSGPGIAEGELADLFKSYLRNNVAQEQAIGLGLETVRVTVEAHMGTLKLFNRLGGGTEVIMTLPAHLRADWAASQGNGS